MRGNTLRIVLVGYCDWLLSLNQFYSSSLNRLWCGQAEKGDVNGAHLGALLGAFPAWHVAVLHQPCSAYGFVYASGDRFWLGLELAGVVREYAGTDTCCRKSSLGAKSVQFAL